MKSVVSFFSFLVVALLMSPVEAQTQAYAGVGLGISVPNAENSSSRPFTHVMAGARMERELGVGIFFSSSDKQESVDGVNRKFGYSIYGFEGSYHFDNVADGAFVGIRLGFAEVQQELSTGKAEVTPLAWGLHFGYDHFLGRHFSLGGEGGFLSVQGEKATVAAETVGVDSFTMLNFLVTAKFWF